MGDVNNRMRGMLPKGAETHQGRSGLVVGVRPHPGKPEDMGMINLWQHMVYIVPVLCWV